MNVAEASASTPRFRFRIWWIAVLALFLYCVWLSLNAAQALVYAYRGCEPAACDVRVSLRWNGDYVLHYTGTPQFRITLDRFFTTPAQEWRADREAEKRRWRLAVLATMRECWTRRGQTPPEIENLTANWAARWPTDKRPWQSQMHDLGQCWCEDGGMLYCRAIGGGHAPRSEGQRPLASNFRDDDGNWYTQD